MMSSEQRQRAEQKRTASANTGGDVDGITGWCDRGSGSRPEADLTCSCHDEEVSGRGYCMLTLQLL